MRQDNLKTLSHRKSQYLVQIVFWWEYMQHEAEVWSVKTPKITAFQIISQMTSLSDFPK